MSKYFALALGCGTRNRNDDWLEVYFPDPLLHPDDALVEAIREEVDYTSGNVSLELNHRQISHVAREWREAGNEHAASYAVAMQETPRAVVLVILQTDAAQRSTPDAYLKLHLRSQRLVKPHGTDLSGILPLLPNVARTNEGAADQ